MSERVKANNITQASKSRSVTFFKGLTGMIVVIILATVVACMITMRTEKYTIPSESMQPGINTGDTVLVVKGGKGDYKRGDVIVFHSFEGNGEVYIKRIIGIPGDNVSIQDGRLFINGEEREEDYVKEPWNGWQTVCGKEKGMWFGIQIADGEYYVMGDNRMNSMDSRCFGTISRGAIIGKAVMKISPDMKFL